MEGLRKVNNLDFEESWKRIEAAQKDWPKCQRCGEPVKPGTVCECVRLYNEETERKIIRRQWDIKRLGGLLAFERYTMTNYDNEAAKKAASVYPGQNLYIWGKSGVGKTHLATACVRRFEDGVCMRAAALCREIATKSADRAEELITKASEAKHILIDDLDTDIKHGLGALREIIAQRDMDGMTGLIITSNLSLAELAQKSGDDRLTSRLAGMCRGIELTGPDRRLLRAKERNTKG